MDNSDKIRAADLADAFDKLRERYDGGNPNYRPTVRQLAAEATTVRYVKETEALEAEIARSKATWAKLDTQLSVYLPDGSILPVIERS
jgi:hypothetical protein